MALRDGMFAAWEMNEASGNAADSQGSDTLSDNSSVGSNTGHVYSLARSFTAASSQYFSHADDAGLSAGERDKTFEVWFKGASFGTNDLISKLNNFFTEFELQYWTVIGLYVQYDGGTGKSAVWGGLSVDTWYQCIFWYDSVAHQLGITVNDGTPVTTDTTGAAVPDTDGDFNVGRRAVSANHYWDGLIGPIRGWNRMLTSGERTSLYNGGAGLTLAAMGGGGGPTGSPQNAYAQQQ